MKKTLSQISTLLVAVTLFSTSVSSQIVYTDIPDGVPSGIDFNSDGVSEFDITTNTNSGDYITYFGKGTDNNIHAIGTLSTSGWDVPSLVASGFKIDNTNQWEGAGDCSIDNWGAGNSTLTFNQDAYLAVRFNIGSNLHYGWIRINSDNSGIITYKDYAYNATPSTSINAGDNGTSSVVLVNSISIQGTGGISAITTNGGTLQMLSNLLPANASNQTVTWSVVNGTGTATINASGLLSAKTNGVVTVSAMANDGSGVTGSSNITISNQVVGIQETGIILTKIFPNPLSDFLIIESLNNESINEIKIFTINGSLVFQESFNSSSERINLTHLNTGIYFAKILMSNGDLHFQKLIKK